MGGAAGSVESVGQGNKQRPRESQPVRWRANPGSGRVAACPGNDRLRLVKLIIFNNR